MDNVHGCRCIKVYHDMRIGDYLAVYTCLSLVLNFTVYKKKRTTVPMTNYMFFVFLCEALLF